MSSAALQKLLDGPAMKPPLGIKPNFTDPPNFRTAMLVVEVIFLVIPTLAIFMRLYTKARINRNVTLDDCKTSWHFTCLVKNHTDLP